MGDACAALLPGDGRLRSRHLHPGYPLIPGDTRCRRSMPGFYMALVLTEQPDRAALSGARAAPAGIFDPWRHGAPVRPQRRNRGHYQPVRFVYDVCRASAPARPVGGIIVVGAPSKSLIVGKSGAGRDFTGRFEPIGALARLMR
jgi:hypothetical protein